MLSATLALLAGCDSYRLLDQFDLPGDKATGEELTLTLDKETALRGATVGLNPNGGTGPYSFEVLADDLYSGTAGESIGAVEGTDYIAGEAIGRFKLTVTDAAGDQADAYVAIVPPAPIITTTARIGGGQTVNLVWTYAEAGIIDNFKVQRSTDGGSFETLAYPGSGATSFNENGLDPGAQYTYRLYAVSGAYSSTAVEVDI
jgi:hypothetical protein